MADNSSKVPVAVLEYEPSAFEQTLLKHKSKLILVGILAVGGTMAYWGYRLYAEASHKSAAVAFARAGSVQELKEVASKHEGKAGAGNALVAAADQMSADNPKEAVALLQDYLSKYPNHPLRDLASWRIAEYQAKAGDTAAAEKSYDEVIKAGSPYAAFALLRLGDARWAAGETDKAKEFYDRILTNSAMAGSPIRNQAKNRVEKALKAKPPVMVEYKEDPPPAPPTPPAPGGLTEPGALLPAPNLPKLPESPESPVAPVTPVPAQPASPDTPAESKPAGDAKPAEAPKPVEPAKPAEPATPAEPAKPADPVAGKDK